MRVAELGKSDFAKGTSQKILSVSLLIHAAFMQKEGSTAVSKAGCTLRWCLSNCGPRLPGSF